MSRTSVIDVKASSKSRTRPEWHLLKPKTNSSVIPAQEGVAKVVAPSPPAGEGWDEGFIKQGVSFLPLTLALFRKGRGDFSDTLEGRNPCMDWHGA
jgi:hypothetical protein